MQNNILKPDLAFFQISESDARKEGVISALQSFETAIMLIGYGRWPSIILLLWGGCEALLRSIYSNSKDDVYLLQERFKVESNLSDALNHSSHELRKFRNLITHNGYLPRDTPRCIDLFFNAGFPYYDSLIKHITGRGLLDQFFPKYNGSLGDILNKTRKVAIRRSIKKKTYRRFFVFFDSLGPSSL